MRVNLNEQSTQELLNYIDQLSQRIQRIQLEQKRCFEIIAERVSNVEEGATAIAIAVPRPSSQEEISEDDTADNNTRTTVQQSARTPITSPRELSRGDRVWINNSISHNTGDENEDRSATVTKVNHITKRVSFETDSGIITNRNIKYLLKISE